MQLCKGAAWNSDPAVSGEDRRVFQVAPGGSLTAPIAVADPIVVVDLIAVVDPNVAVDLSEAGDLIAGVDQNAPADRYAAVVHVALSVAVDPSVAVAPTVVVVRSVVVDPIVPGARIAAEILNAEEDQSAVVDLSVGAAQNDPARNAAHDVALNAAPISP